MNVRIRSVMKFLSSFLFAFFVVFPFGILAQVPVEWANSPQVRVSALLDEGIQELENTIFDLATGDVNAQGAGEFAPNLRQKELLEKSLAAAEAASQGWKNGAPGCDRKPCR